MQLHPTLYPSRTHPERAQAKNIFLWSRVRGVQEDLARAASKRRGSVLKKRDTPARMETQWRDMMLVDFVEAIVRIATMVSGGDALPSGHL